MEVDSYQDNAESEEGEKKKARDGVERKQSDDFSVYEH